MHLALDVTAGSSIEGPGDDDVHCDRHVGYLAVSVREPRGVVSPSAFVLACVFM